VVIFLLLGNREGCPYKSTIWNASFFIYAFAKFPSIGSVLQAIALILLSLLNK
jgi:hypothetical protein